ncbi:hypothetical protein [Ligilactobacillus aviarius]|uniref:hypothetical protein n=1 Tax=Ligilactobacillus aviarius TaxID=1606 RepID=UPI00195E5445|nr:hypothetical protein [Ligilactobacillus aviarius]MBM6862269.1 hypothetical protein [Ligilactobacillus aviarius]
MTGSLSTFKKYQGEWYIYKDMHDTFDLELNESNYCLKLKLNLDSSCKSMICFRLEDYKEYYFGDKRIGPKDCDLTVLEDNNVYQIEVKDIRHKAKDFDSANNQINVCDNLLRSILWFIDPKDMCGLKNFNSEHIIIHLRQKSRESLERGFKAKKTKNYKIVTVNMDRKQKSRECNFRKIIKAAEHAS